MSAPDPGRAAGRASRPAQARAAAPAQVPVRPVDAPVFSRRALALVCGLSGASFVVALVVLALGAELREPRSRAADAFSRSAIGHQGLVRLLRALDVPVVVSRHASARRADASAALILAEPGRPPAAVPGAALAPDEAARARLEEILDGTEAAVLIVLAKRTALGRPAEGDEGWARQTGLVDEAQAAAPLAALGLDRARLRRLDAAPALARGDGAAAPTPTAPVQLIVERAGALEPLVWADGGILLGRLRDRAGRPRRAREVYVLADPDVLANHGLGRGDNAAFALDLVDRLRAPGGAVVLDETLHGHEVEPSLWGELLRWPLLALTLHAVLVAGLAAWAGAVRVGAPIAPPPAIEPGKGQLIAHTAALLGHGGHTAHALRRYHEAAVAEVARALHAPAGLDREGLLAWLDRAARARAGAAPLAALDARARRLASAGSRASERDLLALALAIHAWKTGMTQGAAPRP